MHWKRVGHDLEWIVRQMSWTPPWTRCDPRGFLDEHPSLLRERKRVADTMGEHDPADATTVLANVKVADADSNSESGAESSQGAHETSVAREEGNQEGMAALIGEGMDMSGASWPGTSNTVPPRCVWRQPPVHIVEDAYGYNRILAFWFTLSLPV